MDETEAWLQGMGADVVTTPQDLKAALGEQRGIRPIHMYWAGISGWSPWAIYCIMLQCGTDGMSTGTCVVMFYENF